MNVHGYLLCFERSHPPSFYPRTITFGFLTLHACLRIYNSCCCCFFFPLANICNIFSVFSVFFMLQHSSNKKNQMICFGLALIARWFIPDWELNLGHGGEMQCTSPTGTSVPPAPIHRIKLWTSVGDEAPKYLPHSLSA